MGIEIKGVFGRSLFPQKDILVTIFIFMRQRRRFSSQSPNPIVVGCMFCAYYIYACLHFHAPHTLVYAFFFFKYYVVVKIRILYQ